MINPTSAVPLYVQVADDLRRRIEMGEFSESGVLPSENGFCEEYEVSRATIRKTRPSQYGDANHQQLVHIAAQH